MTRIRSQTDRRSESAHARGFRAAPIRASLIAQTSLVAVRSGIRLGGTMPPRSLRQWLARRSRGEPVSTEGPVQIADTSLSGFMLCPYGARGWAQRRADVAVRVSNFAVAVASIGGAAGRQAAVSRRPQGAARRRAVSKSLEVARTRSPAMSAFPPLSEDKQTSGERV